MSYFNTSYNQSLKQPLSIPIYPGNYTTNYYHFSGTLVAYYYIKHKAGGNCHGTKKMETKK